jgi:hypothetical protein
MKLTPRQSTAVAALLDLYAEGEQQPIAYAQVAQRLGVAPTTAYRMLRLAEKLGYVRATYPGHAGQPGAGRSPVLFAPTDLARGVVTSYAGPTPPDEAWEATRARILEALASTQQPNAVADVVEELLAGLEESGTPIDVAGRTIATLMISLEESLGDEAELDLLDRLARPGTRFGLSTLSGMLLGLAWANRTTRSVADRLERQVARFQAAVADLSPEQSQSLAGFLAQLDVGLRARRRHATGSPRSTD